MSQICGMGTLAIIQLSQSLSNLETLSLSLYIMQFSTFTQFRLEKKMKQHAQKCIQSAHGRGHIFGYHNLP